MNLSAAQHGYDSGAVLTLLVLVFLAVIRSSRKGHALPFILGCMAGGFAVGAAIGYALGGSRAAGALSGVLTQFSGIAASINRMMRYRKPKSPVG